VSADAEDLTAVGTALEDWCQKRRWLGPDPYEALNGRRMPPTPTPTLRRVAIQLVKRSPLDLRKPLGIEPRHNSATIAHALTAYSAGGFVSPELRLERARWAIERLEELRVPACSNPAWGYHFDVETRFFRYGAETPNTIATAFAGHALLDADEAFGLAGARELGLDAARFFLDNIEQTPGPGGAFFGYYPGDRTPIHNASLLAASLLARAGAVGDQSDMSSAAAAGLGYALAHQRPDGSWPYAEGGKGDWIDNFHTGYVLDALLRCAEALDSEPAREAWARGLDYYDRALFDPDGTPRFTDTDRFPIDGQCVAQAIETFVRAAAVEPRWDQQAVRSFRFAVDRMRRRDGAFIFQRRRFWVNPTPHVRWVQAPMLRALALLERRLRSAQEASG